MVHIKGSRCDHVALDLVHHEKTHTGEKPFSRSFCDYTATHKGVPRGCHRAYNKDSYW